MKITPASKGLIFSSEPVCPYVATSSALPVVELLAGNIPAITRVKGDRFCL